MVPCSVMQGIALQKSAAWEHRGAVRARPANAYSGRTGAGPYTAKALCARPDDVGAVGAKGRSAGPRLWLRPLRRHMPFEGGAPVPHPWASHNGPLGQVFAQVPLPLVVCPPWGVAIGGSFPCSLPCPRQAAWWLGGGRSDNPHTSRRPTHWPSSVAPPSPARPS